MLRLLLLDFNVIGIITSFISDDFDYLYFLKKNNIKPYHKEIDWNNVDWNNISNNIENYDISIIDEFKDNFNWDSLTTQKMENQEFLSKYKDYINFELINQSMRFSYTIDYNFYEENNEKLDWVRLSRWANMAEDFIDLYHDRLDWSVLCRSQGLTEYIMNKYFHKLIITDLRYNYHIETTLRNEIIQRLENQENNEENNNNQENDEENDEENEDFDISDNIPEEEYIMNLI